MQLLGHLMVLSVVVSCLQVLASYLHHQRQQQLQLQLEACWLEPESRELKGRTDCASICQLIPNNSKQASMQGHTLVKGS